MEHRRLLHTDFDVLNKIAEETNHTVAQVVFNRLLSRPTITRLAIGTTSMQNQVFFRANSYSGKFRGFGPLATAKSVR